RICGSKRLAGPTEPPAGARAVAPTENLPQVVREAPANTTFWLESGTHYLGDAAYDQVRPKSQDSFIGAPGAILDGRNVSLYAFTGHARDVSISHLTIQNFVKPGDNMNEGVVNHDSGQSWKIRYNTIRANAGAGVMLGSGSVLQ